VNVEALILYGVFGLIAFGWRTWLQWRRTGDTDDTRLRIHATVGTTQWWAELGFVAGVRNPTPTFTAMLVTAVGLSLLVGNVVGVFAAVALFIALEVQVRSVEEPYLRSLHGPTYDQYLATAGRFLPGLGITRQS
jgi:protein-S-isoprenylcysteine O-methyltransferase Ste14